MGAWMPYGDLTKKRTTMDVPKSLVFWCNNCDAELDRRVGVAIVDWVLEDGTAEVLCAECWEAWRAMKKLQ